MQRPRVPALAGGGRAQAAAARPRRCPRRAPRTTSASTSRKSTAACARRRSRKSRKSSISTRMNLFRSSAAGSITRVTQMNALVPPLALCRATGSAGARGSRRATAASRRRRSFSCARRRRQEAVGGAGRRRDQGSLASDGVAWDGAFGRRRSTGHGIRAENVGAGAIMGSVEQTQRMLSANPSEGKGRHADGGNPRSRGQKHLGQACERQRGVLASYLKNEYPQTVAVVLAKVRPEHAAKVLAELPQDFAAECVMRMLAMEPVQREILERSRRRSAPNSCRTSRAHQSATATS
jgi:hypothetical protein